VRWCASDRVGAHEAGAARPPGTAEIRLANRNNLDVGRDAAVTGVDFSVGPIKRGLADAPSDPQKRARVLSGTRLLHPRHAVDPGRRVAPIEVSRGWPQRIILRDLSFAN
jgi:hypothetical protein